MGVQVPDIEPEKTIKEIDDLLQTSLKKLNRDAVLIGLSGGLDSAVVAYLAVRSLGAERVHLMYLPDRDSDPRHRQDAHHIAELLGVRLTVRSVTGVVRRMGGYRVLPLWFIPTRWLRMKLVNYGRREFHYEDNLALLQQRLIPEPDSWLARGNAYSIAKHRARMVVLYQEAQLHNWMVAGAANRTEWLTGTFSQWGIDHCADVMPIIHLYRSQVLSLAAYLKVPARVQIKPADPDLLPGINDKQELLGPFDTVDNILYGLEAGAKKKTLYKEFGRPEVRRIRDLMNASDYMRAAPRHLLGD